MSSLPSAYPQGPMGAAIDTWVQTWLLDPPALLLHEGRVRTLTQEPRSWPGNHSSAVRSIGIDETKLKVGSRERLFGIATDYFYREPSETRSQGEPGIEDVEQTWDLAIRTNTSLLWRGAGEGWPSPLGFATLNEFLANGEVERLATRYSEFLNARDERCGQLMATFIAIYRIRFDDC